MTLERVTNNYYSIIQGLKEDEPNGRDVYPDIIDHPHWQLPTRPHMSLYDRAAQFSSFDALAGYSDMVKEEQRLTDTQIQLEEYELERLNQKLTLISDVITDGHKPTVTITYFVPDKRKTGGRYDSVTEEVKKIDPIKRQIVLTKTVGRGGVNATIDIDKVESITGELVDYMDDTID